MEVSKWGKVDDNIIQEYKEEKEDKEKPKEEGKKSQRFWKYHLAIKNCQGLWRSVMENGNEPEIKLLISNGR